MPRLNTLNWHTVKAMFPSCNVYLFQQTNIRWTVNKDTPPFVYRRRLIVSSFLTLSSLPPFALQTLPIYELVRRSTAAAHVGQRLANLQKGWEEYQRHFDSCRCESCKHSGIAVLAGTSCECNCRSGYQGVACEETLRRGKRGEH